MPKESPTASSLRAGPANPGSRAGWAPPNPPGPWWGLCSPAPSPRDPRTPVSPSPGLAESCGQGLGTGAARAAVGRGSGARRLPVEAVPFGGIGGDPRVLPGAAGGPATANTLHSTRELLREQGDAVPKTPNPPRRRDPRGAGDAQEEVGEGRLWQAVPGVIPGRFGVPRALPGGSTLVSAGVSIWECPGTPGRLSPHHEHHSPAPSTALGRKPKTGAAGGHRDLIRHRAVPPCPPCPQAAPQHPGCSQALWLYQDHGAHPSASTWCHKATKNKAWGTLIPAPRTSQHRCGAKKNPWKHPVRASPAATTAAVLPAPLFFGNITR